MDRIPVSRWVTATFALFAFVLTAAPTAAFEWKALDPNYEPTWDKIKRTGTIQTGCMQQPPYWRKVTGGWSGYGVAMAEDMAKQLGVKWECVETTWGTAALARISQTP